MSRKRNYLEDTTLVMQRTFDAIKTLVEFGIYKSENDYCKTHGIDYANYFKQRNDLGRGFYQIGWATPMIHEHNLSPQWLLTGSGHMFIPK